MRLRTFLILTGLAYVAARIVRDRNPSTARSAEEFAELAAHSNMFEIQSSRLAVDKARSEEVRRLAQRMIDEHTRIAQAMKLAAAKEGIAHLPDGLDDRHLQRMDTLKSSDDDSFDDQYLHQQLEAHRKAVVLFDSFAKRQGAMADFARETTPTLRKHLYATREIFR